MGICPKTDQTRCKQTGKQYTKNKKEVVQIANLSVPSTGKWILDILGKHSCRPFLEIVESEIPTFSKTWTSGGSSEGAAFNCLAARGILLLLAVTIPSAARFPPYLSEDKGGRARVPPEPLCRA